MDFTAIGVSKYKLFSEICIPDLAKVNVIIGKNNCGKSSLLDVIGAAYSVKDYHNVKSEMEKLGGSTLITDEMIRGVLQGYNSIGRWNQSRYSEVLVGKTLDFFIADKFAGLSDQKWESQIEVSSDIPEIVELKGFWNRGVWPIENSINNFIFRSI